MDCSCARNPQSLKIFIQGSLLPLAGTLRKTPASLILI